MKKTHINNQEAQASAKLRLEPGKSKKELVGKARDVVSRIKAHPDYPNRPEVQQVTTAFEKSTDAVEKTASALSAVRAQEEALLSSMVILLADLKRSGRSVVAVIDETAKGSADGITQWGLEVAGKQPPSTSIAPPTGLRAVVSRQHGLMLRWNGVRSHKGYELQFGDGTQQGWGAPVQVARARFVPSGFPPGPRAVRVAVRRTNGLSAYSDPVTVTFP